MALVEFKRSGTLKSGGNEVRARRVRRLIPAGVLTAGACALCYCAALGQQPVRVIRPQQLQQPLQAQQRVQRPNQPGSRNDSAPMLIETSAPIANLLSRAEEGIAREDWKFAIDSLQRVLEDDEGSVVACDAGNAAGGARFESARRLAQRRLIELPEEGRAAYRLLYDGIAKALFERAVTNHDPALLQVIIDRHLATSFGGRAASLLASWLIDQGRAAEAIGILQDAIEGTDEESDARKPLIGKLAVARTLAGGSGTEVSPEWAQGIAEVQAWYAGSGDGDESHESWSFAQTHARAPLVEPTIDKAPWGYELSGTNAKLWRRIYKDDPSDPLILPTSQLAFQGARIFTRTRSACVALHAEDLSLLWESRVEVPSGTPQQGTGTARFGGQSTVTNEVSEDFLSASISAGVGLVFTIESASFASSVTDPAEVFPVLPGQVQRVAGTKASRLVAYDQETGALRWSRGGFVGPADDMHDVTFRGPPIVVGSRLWVPFTRQNDLYVALLNPADGSTHRSRLIGSVSGATTAPLSPILLTAGGGAVYVPWHGALISLLADNAMIKWAAQYARQVKAHRPDGTLSAESVPSAPILSGEMVLLAPNDSLDLMAFSATDGSFAWSSRRETSQYLLSAADGKIWLGGRTFACLSAANGTKIWSAEIIGVPTGRASLSGNRIHIPISTGLITLDADSGMTASEQTLASAEGPLGNVYCSGTSLYSVEASSVRRFLDVERTYTVALSSIEQGDATSLIRLAWVELVRGEPRKAKEALSRLPKGGAGRLPEGTTRIHLAIALALSNEPGADINDSIAALKSAETLDIADKDRLDVLLRLAGLQQVSGNLSAARKTLMDIGLSSLAEVMVPVSELVSSPARFAVAERMRNLTGDAAGEVEDEFKEWLASLQSAIAERRLTPVEGKRLSALSELEISPELSARALLVLAADDRLGRRYERGERRLLQIVEGDFADDAKLSAWLALADLYGTSHQNDVESLAWALTQVERRFAAAEIPADAPARMNHGEKDDANVLVRDWVEKYRASIPSATQEILGNLFSESKERAGRSISLTDQLAWVYGGALENNSTPRITPRLQEENPAFRMVLFDTDTSATVQRLVGFATTNRLECLDPLSGQVMWRSEMRLSEDFELKRDEESKGPRTALNSGQIGIFNSGEGIFAVGLITGRLLWGKPYEVPYDTNTYIYGDRAMALGGNALAAMPRDGRLGLYRLYDGVTIWERELRGEPVHAVSMDETRVMTFDVTNQRIHILNRTNGGLIKQVLLRQPDPGHEIVPVVHSEGKLFAPDVSPQGDAVLGIDLRDGSELWRFPVGKPIASLFEPRAGYIGAGLLGGELRILNSLTGEVVLEPSVAGARTIVDAKLVAGTLVALLSIQKGDRRVMDAVGFDVATGDELWRRSDVIALASNASLELTGDFLPVIGEFNRAEISAVGVAQPKTKTMLGLLDVRTGANAGTMLDVSSSSVRATGEVALYPGVLVIGNTRGLWGYRTTQPGSSNGRF